MRKIILFASLAFVAAPALTAPPRPATVVVRLQDRKFHPQVIRLKGGVPTRLVLINRDRSEHDFYAPDFFIGARLSRHDIRALDNNRLNVRSGRSRAITVTPHSGHYDVKSTKALDVASGMQGQILVF